MSNISSYITYNYAEVNMLVPVLQCECWGDAGIELILLWHHEYSISSIQPIRKSNFWTSRIIWLGNLSFFQQRSQHSWCSGCWHHNYCEQGFTASSQRPWFNQLAFQPTQVHAVVGWLRQLQQQWAMIVPTSWCACSHINVQKQQIHWLP